MAAILVITNGDQDWRVRNNMRQLHYVCRGRFPFIVVKEIATFAIMAGRGDCFAKIYRPGKSKGGRRLSLRRIDG